MAAHQHYERLDSLWMLHIVTSERPTFHDGHIREVLRAKGYVHVKVQGGSGSFYTVRFRGVRSIQSEAAEGMMLYGLTETDTGDPLVWRYEFVNWYCDEPDTEEFKSKLVILACGFELQELPDEISNAN